MLRRPLGHGRDAVAFPFEAESLHLVALDGGRVVGCVLFHPEGPETGRLFQMAVEPGRQGRGLGTRLVRALEQEVAARGFREVSLHARDAAVGFYARLGYVTFGAPYVEVGVPHQNMRRSLRSAPDFARRERPGEDVEGSGSSSGASPRGPGRG